MQASPAQAAQTCLSKSGEQVLWQYTGEDNVTWHDYPVSVAVYMETRWEEGAKDAVVDFFGSLLSIDLVRWEQREVDAPDTQRANKIRRVILTTQPQPQPQQVKVDATR